MIAAPCCSASRVMWYSDGPGYVSNCHPKSEPQNSRAWAVSSAGISRCTICPAIRPPPVGVSNAYDPATAEISSVLPEGEGVRRDPRREAQLQRALAQLGVAQQRVEAAEAVDRARLS